MGQGNPKDLAKTHGSERGKEEENGPRMPKERNRPREGQGMEWASLARMLASETQKKKECKKWTSSSFSL